MMRVMPMLRCAAFLLLAALVLPTQAVTPVHKCTGENSPSYQGQPCRSALAAERPTVEQLNAQRKQQLAAEKAARTAPAKPSPAASTASASPGTVPLAQSRFRCDGRTRCGQMRSCEEARYFLRHCPTVAMDGDGDGEPCERQLCGPS